MPPVSRRAVLRTIPLAAVLGAGLAACSSNSSSSALSSASATASASAGVDLGTTDASLALSTKAWKYDSDNEVYYQMGLEYGSSIQDSSYETLSIFVPGAYMTATDNGDDTYTLAVDASGTAGDYKASTAPMVLPVNTPGYAAQQPLTEYSYDTIQSYMEAGLVYVHAGLRGKDSTTDSAAGNAPWGVTDLKAAIRYLRYNADSLPGDADQVYVFGHSGGGAQSAVAGASGDSSLYEPYLKAIGAAGTATDGSKLSDAVAGAMCWCPITSLDEANAAYQWNMGQFASSDTRADGTWTAEYSKNLAEAFPDFVNGLGLKDSDGQALSLSESDDGVYLAGTYYEHLIGVIEDSLNTFIENTTFPYTPSSTEMAGMDTSGGAPSGSAPSGSAPSDSGSAPSGMAPSGAPDDSSSSSSSSSDSSSGSAPSGSAPSDSSSSSSGSSTTYDTLDDYIDYLNSDSTWVTYDSSTKKATVTSLSGFVTSQKSPTKDVGALDGVDRGETENTVMGVGSTALHFSQISRDVIADNEDAYAKISDWSDDYASSEYDSDFEEEDSVGETPLTREHMYNPLYFLVDGQDGYAASTVAPSWRIRTGIMQGDTATTTEMNLALALGMLDKEVDFETVWGQGHTMAEVTGDGETNFIAWVKERATA